jgi:hypothetical protein
VWGKSLNTGVLKTSSHPTNDESSKCSVYSGTKKNMATNERRNTIYFNKVWREDPVEYIKAKIPR